MRFLDVFSGIGGFRMGLEQAGHTCIGHVEIDKYARQAYAAIYDIKEDEFDGRDVKKIDNFKTLGGGYDILVGGFPCQSFSIAGHRRGFEDTRGTMFFELARILEQTKPPICLFENVKGLLSHDKGRTFETILSTMDELGYDVEWKLLNSKDFGVPQNRERVYIVGHLRGERTRKVFSNSGTRSEANDSEYATTVPTRYRGAGGQTYIASKQKILKIGGGKSQGTRVYSPNGLAITRSALGGGFGTKTGLYQVKQKPMAMPVLTPERSKKRQKGRRFKTDGEPMFTLTAQDHHGVLVESKDSVKIKSCVRKGYEEAEPGDSINLSHPDSKTRSGRVGDKVFNTLTTYGRMGTLEHDGQEYRIRKLTPRECWRLQGFPDQAFDKAKATGLSDSQLYKQAGNAVTVNVVKWIGERMVVEND